MKRLRKLAVNIDRMQWPNDYGYQFYLRSRALCNFIERRLKSEAVSFTESTKLVVTGRNISNPEFRINSSSVACLDVPFNSTDYDKLKSDEDHNAFMCSFLRTNLALLPCSPCSDLERLRSLVDEFAQGGYDNSWVHKRRKLQELKVTAELRCRLTPSVFSLFLEVEGDGQTLYEDTLLELDPDEFAFDHRFKDIVVDSGDLVVTSKLEEPLARIPLTSIREGHKMTAPNQ